MKSISAAETGQNRSGEGVLYCTGKVSEVPDSIVMLILCINIIKTVTV